MDVNTEGKESCQAACFTPKRTLARTPPKKLRGVENISPSVTTKPPPAPHSINTANKSTKQQQQGLGKDDRKKKAQGTRLSEKCALKERNTQAEQDTYRKDTQEPVIDEIPPPSHWELPRTPIRVVEHVQLPVPASATDGRGATPTQRTPVRIKTPIHPLAHSNKATPTPATSKPTETGTPTIGEGERDNCVKGGQFTANDEKPLQTGDGGRNEVEKITTNCSSPPISVTKGIGTLPGLHCTDNDLAFLQQMESIRKYEELKAEAEKLEKVHKTAAEQKEQFQHEILKIERDLQNMKLSYEDTSSSVFSLISNSTRENQGEATANSTIRCKSALQQQPPKPAGQIELTQAQLGQLRKLNQLSSARVEKTEKEVKGKLGEVERAKWQIQSKIREEEERKLGEKTHLQSMFETTQQEEEKWRQKVDHEEENYTSLKNQLTEAESELATLQQQNELEENTETLTSDNDKSFCVAEEKKRTEEKLKRFIRRCELYIQRHQMLREMGTKI